MHNDYSTGNKKAILYVVSAASGAGKTSLVNAVLKQLPGVELSVSHTTRARREGETDGVDYHFVSMAKFNAMVAAKDFFEYARVFGNMYGTSRQHIQQQLDQGNDVILEIDWQGARQIRQLVDNCKTVHILPPSIRVLRERLMARGQDDDAVIGQRMQAAVNEISHYAEYDYLIINDDFALARDELAAIIMSNRLLLEHQQQQYVDLLSELLTTNDS